MEAGAKAEVEATESKRTIILLRDMLTRHADKIKLWSCGLVFHLERLLLRDGESSKIG